MDNEKKRRWLRLPSPALIVAMIALFVSLTQTGLASRAVQVVQAGCNCGNSSDIINNSLTSVDIKNGSLLRKDFKKGQVPRGPRGARGPAGANGANGAQGPQGPQGPRDRRGPPGQMARLGRRAPQPRSSGPQSTRSERLGRTAALRPQATQVPASTRSTSTRTLRTVCTWRRAATMVAASSLATTCTPGELARTPLQSTSSTRATQRSTGRSMSPCSADRFVLSIGKPRNPQRYRTVADWQSEAAFGPPRLFSYTRLCAQLISR